jgi:uncharacterized protein
MIPKVIRKSKAEIIEICRKHQIRDFTDESDFDFLVDFLPEAKVGFIELGRIKYELEDVVETDVDLVPKSGLKPLIKEHVLSEAEIIYAA